MRAMERPQFLLVHPSIRVLHPLPGTCTHLIKIHIRWLHTRHKYAGCIQEAYQPAHDRRKEQEQDEHAEHAAGSRHDLCSDGAKYEDGNVETLETGCDHDHLFGRILDPCEGLHRSLIPYLAPVFSHAL